MKRLWYYDNGRWYQTQLHPDLDQLRGMLRRCGYPTCVEVEHEERIRRQDAAIEKLLTR